MRHVSEEARLILILINWFQARCYIFEVHSNPDTKVIIIRYQHKYLFGLWMGYTATCFDHEVVIFRLLKYIWLKLQVQSNFRIIIENIVSKTT
jgi:hypothetical protein